MPTPIIPICAAITLCNEIKCTLLGYMIISMCVLTANTEVPADSLPCVAGLLLLLRDCESGITEFSVLISSADITGSYKIHKCFVYF